MALDSFFRHFYTRAHLHPHFRSSFLHRKILRPFFTYTYKFSYTWQSDNRMRVYLLLVGMRV